MAEDSGARGRTLIGAGSSPKPTTGDAMPLDQAIAPGARIRQYEVIREIGRGGMGRVLLARDTRLGRRVAMKFLTSESRELTERFLVEARTTALVNHDNIVVIYEVDEHDGAPYMVLEYLEGSSLREVCDGGRLPAARVVEIAVPIVRALVRAHEAGIVHRDLKPENVLLTEAGGVKVLDFGIAKLLAGSPDLARRSPRDVTLHGARSKPLTMAHTLVGTLPYMSPEQLNCVDIDHRSDLWALGIMMFEMVTGHHPLPQESSMALIAEVVDLARPMPGVGTYVNDVPERLEQIIERCLVKPRDARYDTAARLLADLEALLPGRYGRQLADDESPYPGLTAFQETDADRFFGRAHDVARMVTRLREQPLVGIVGPSGVGKSSFVRAGVVPALKSSGDDWEVHVIRPGRQPLVTLASIVARYATGRTATGEQLAREQATIADRLAVEPGHLGVLFRGRAARKNTRVLLFVDQFEELYTVVADPAERLAFTTCLVAAADDAAAPVRVVVSMRSDFLDRAGEDPRFLDELTRNLVFLQPLGPAALRDAIVQPLDMRGYQFEAPEMIDDMLATLASTPGALPLLQFAAAKLWETRDRVHRLLTRAYYDAMGGISGALATHADQVLQTLSPTGQRHVRAIMLRLITTERTRAIVDLGELRGLSSEPRDIEKIVDYLVGARLLVVGSTSTSVEIAHESLIETWPTLRRWLDEGQEDAVQLAQLRAASAQWDHKGRTPGLVWRGEAVAEARRWHARYRGDLPERERAFLAAAFALATRSARLKRSVVAMLIAMLGLGFAGSSIALLKIHDAEQDARRHASHAETETQHAQQEQQRATVEAARAKEAERVAQQRLEQVKAEQVAKQQAEDVARKKGVEVEMTHAQLEVALAKAQRERALAQDETAKAKAAAQAEKQAREEARRLYLTEKARADAAEKQRTKITTELSK